MLIGGEPSNPPICRASYRVMSQPLKTSEEKTQMPAAIVSCKCVEFVNDYRPDVA